MHPGGETSLPGEHLDVTTYKCAPAVSCSCKLLTCPHMAAIYAPTPPPHNLSKRTYQSKHNPARRLRASGRLGALPCMHTELIHAG
eukprot:351280-Chlamydomonas_euryale.AAC.5